jgi:hypothetical protein
MQYMFLIYSDESQMPDPPTDPAGVAAMMEPWLAYNRALQEAGVFVAGDALQPTSTATTVTATRGAPVFTDGPFAETREQLGGYYLVDCADLDQAMHWAAKCPGTAFGRVEVRPVMNVG